MILVHPADQQALLDGALAGVAPEQVRLVIDDAIEPGLAFIDAPTSTRSSTPIAP